MIKCTMLLPFHDNDGKALVIETNKVLKILYEKFDGYSTEGTTAGTYRMRDGLRSVDVSLRVSVCVKPSRLGELRRLAKDFAHLLRQETLYFETSCDVEFIVERENLLRPSLEPEPELPAPISFGSDAPQLCPSGGFPYGKACQTVGEAIEYFDGRSPELADALQIAREVREDGSVERGGELRKLTVDFLRGFGLHVVVYGERGVKSTVIRPTKFVEIPPRVSIQ